MAMGAAESVAGLLAMSRPVAAGGAAFAASASPGATALPPAAWVLQHADQRGQGVAMGAAESVAGLLAMSRPVAAGGAASSAPAWLGAMALPASAWALQHIDQRGQDAAMGAAASVAGLLAMSRPVGAYGAAFAASASPGAPALPPAAWALQHRGPAGTAGTGPAGPAGTGPAGTAQLSASGDAASRAGHQGPRMARTAVEAFAGLLAASRPVALGGAALTAAMSRCLYLGCWMYGCLVFHC